MIDQITVCTHCRDFAGAVAFQQAPETEKKSGSDWLCKSGIYTLKVKMYSEPMSVFKSNTEKLSFRKK